MTRFFVLTLFILLVTATSCTDNLTVTDTAVPLEAPAGETFDIVLKANVTTGYEWRLAEPLDESVVQFISSDYESDKPIAEGSGGLDIWTFQAVAPGTSQIVLGYFPPDGSDMPDQTSTFTVIVE
ncbi:MAG: protease inhibitor I42 family protein [Anaerolineae bacterium]|nr:protease inhibitor I42 family protein [Anaerolineae bacterium]